MPLADGGFTYFRWFLDEAATGTSPTVMADSGPNGYDIDSIVYDGNANWVEHSGNRGFEINSTSGDQRATKAINDTSDAFRDALENSTTVTLEFVLRIDAISGSGSRIFGVRDINEDIEPSLQFGATSTSNFSLKFGENSSEDSSAMDFALATRGVGHIVIDTTESVQADRLLAFKNNVEITSKTIGLNINTNLVMSAGLELNIGNRFNGSTYDRSFDGVLYYLAIYVGVLSAANRTTNYDILIVTDDEEALGGPFASFSRRRNPLINR